MWILIGSKKKQLNKVEQTWTASLVGQDVPDGFIAEADEKAAQSFISQEIFCVPAESMTEPTDLQAN